MRTFVAVAAAIPLGLLVACGGAPRVETATSVPHRDLTLSTSSFATAQVASGIELAPVSATRRAKPRAVAHVRSMPEPAAVAAPATLAVPAAAPAAPVHAAAPVAVAETAQPDPLGRELLPGQTVTIIPVSSGASGSTGAGGGEGWSELPSHRRGGGVIIGGGHGGTCRGGGGRGPVSILK